MRQEWKYEMSATPIIPTWTSSSACATMGAELQRAIIRGFIDTVPTTTPFSFEKIFTFKEHGEFFRGALTMASIRYAGDFYDLLKRVRDHQGYYRQDP